MFPVSSRVESVMQRTYSASYLEREMCGRDVATFRFSKPARYTFTPGQWFRLTLRTPDGPMTETFTHSSAPSDPCIELTTRFTGSSFKRALDALRLGEKVEIAGPGGGLRLPDDLDRVAFMAGGVGITPVRSILRDAVERDVVFEDAVVFFGNRDPGCAPFIEELETMADHGVRVVPVYEDVDGMGPYESGFITADIVRRHVDVGDGRPYLVSGPPVMVEAMERVLDELGIASDQRIVERFGPSMHTVAEGNTQD